MADKYSSYADLAAHETEGVDYSRTAVTVPGATWCAIAIHGGGIERGSGEMAAQVAGAFMSRYEFAGLKSSGNVDLHLTSTVFDEPLGVALVAAHSRCLSFHGYVGTAGVAETAIGGLDSVLVARVTAELLAAGFAVVTAPSEIAGTDPANICNKTSTSAGVQLEMSRALRDSFFPGGATSTGAAAGRTDTFYRYARAVQRAYIGYGRISVGAINSSRWALLPVSLTDVRVSSSVATDKLASGGSVFAGLAARFADTNNTYLARLEFSTTQQVILTLRKRVGGTESLISQFTTGLTHTVGGRICWELDVAGSTLQARAWADGTPPPWWQLASTDTSLTAAGQVGLRSILSTTYSGILPVVATYGPVRVESSYQTVQIDARAVNGIARGWPAGTDVDVWTPAVVPL